MTLTRQQRWARKNRKLINKRSRERYKTNEVYSEERKASSKNYQDNHKEEAVTYNKTYYKTNKPSIKNNQKEYRDTMPDAYIKRLVVCQAKVLEPQDITDDIVLAKRSHLKVTRYIRKLNKLDTPERSSKRKKR